MNRIEGIAYSCAISRDPLENRRNHKQMIDDLNTEIAADGWKGVKVTMLSSHNGRTHIQIEPGIAELTLDYLCSLKRFDRPADPPAAAPTDQSGQASLFA